MKKLAARLGRQLCLATAILIHVPLCLINQGIKLRAGAGGMAPGGRERVQVIQGRFDFLRGVRKDQEEFVAADPVGLCAGMGTALQCPGKLQEEPVPCPVALGVVDLLQVVQVEIPDGQLPAAVGALLGAQMPQIVKPGQRVPVAPVQGAAGQDRQDRQSRQCRDAQAQKDAQAAQGGSQQDQKHVILLWKKPPADLPGAKNQFSSVCSKKVMVQETVTPYSIMSPSSQTMDRLLTRQRQWLSVRSLMTCFAAA